MPVIDKTRPDPLAAFREGLRIGGRSGRPVPLRKTAIAVDVRGCFATVTTTRTFRNDEDASIEATLTWPVPVDAVTHGLRVSIDGRELTGRAVAREAARADYEAALDSGRTAILHEEALKGVHVLSVGHVAPGREVAVVSVWSKPLSFAAGVPSLRIPSTVAEVYGRLPLDPADDFLVSDHLVFEAELVVAVDAGIAHLRGGALSAGAPTIVTLDRPVDLSFTGVAAREVRGRAADGRAVTLSVREDPAADAPLRLGVVFDRSGSTAAPIDDDGRGESVWSVAREGLDAAFKRHLRPDDEIALWQFDGSVEGLGSAKGAEDARRLLLQIEPPRGGTVMGPAIGAAAAHEGLTDILVVTDGRSALAVHDLASCGRRVSTVLCGRNSLDAMIGHLAILTGGQVLVAAGDNAHEAIAKAIAGARRPATPSVGATATVLPQELFEVRGGAEIRVAWADAATGSEGSVDAVGAYAAALVLPTMTTEAATAIAVSHGLCSHLTSLLVVDEAGAAVEGVPNQRKVPLSRPVESFGVSGMSAAAMPVYAAAPQSFMLRSASPILAASAGRGASLKGTMPGDGRSRLFSVDDPAFAPESVSPSRVRRSATPKSKNPGLVQPFDASSASIGSPSSSDLSVLSIVLDWDGGAARLSKADLSDMSPDSVAAIGRIAAHPRVAALAATLGTSALAVVIGLLADRASARSRSAARIARRLLSGADPAEIRSASAAIGL